MRIESTFKAHSTDAAEEIESRTREIAHGLLPALSPAQHGWRRIQRGDVQVLQIWSRLTLPGARLRDLLAKVGAAR